MIDTFFKIMQIGQWGSQIMKELDAVKLAQVSEPRNRFLDACGRFADKRIEGTTTRTGETATHQVILPDPGFHFFFIVADPGSSGKLCVADSNTGSPRQSEPYVSPQLDLHGLIVEQAVPGVHLCEFTAKRPAKYSLFVKHVAQEIIDRALYKGEKHGDGWRIPVTITLPNPNFVVSYAATARLESGETYLHFAEPSTRTRLNCGNEKALIPQETFNRLKAGQHVDVPAADPRNNVWCVKPV